LDTGASGISISAKAAGKDGLEILGDESVDLHGRIARMTGANLEIPG
jgi:hypothetical protein